MKRIVTISLLLALSLGASVSKAQLANPMIHGSISGQFPIEDQEFLDMLSVFQDQARGFDASGLDLIWNGSPEPGAENDTGRYYGLENVKVIEAPFSISAGEEDTLRQTFRIDPYGSDRFGIEDENGNLVLLRPLQTVMQMTGNPVPSSSDQCSIELLPDRVIPCFSQTVYIKAGRNHGSGVLVHPRYVLTALHVVLSTSIPEDMAGSKLAPAREISVSNDYRFNKYNQYSVEQVAHVNLRTENGHFIDLAIMKLHTPVRGEDVAVSPILSASGAANMQSRSLIGVGFGLNPNGTGNGHRRIGMLQCEFCEDDTDPYYMHLESVPFDGTKIISQPCKIDSGSPVYLETDSGSFAIAGILSGTLGGATPVETCSGKTRYVDLSNDAVQRAIIDAIAALDGEIDVARFFPTDPA